jgi:hypothetical protein
LPSWLWDNRLFLRDKENVLTGEQIAQAWAKHYPKHRAEKVSEHVCRLICLCIGYRVSAEISGGDTASRLDRVLASMRIQKKEFDDVTNTYESWTFSALDL